MTPHAHHWMIETPTPGQSFVAGQCLCGAARDFRAFEQDGMDDDEHSPRGVITSRFKRGHHPGKRGAA